MLVGPMRSHIVSHLISLVFRVLLLAAGIYLVVSGRNMQVFLLLIWVKLVTGMLFRLIPNKRIPFGARKHFDYTFGITPAKKQIHKGVYSIAIAWIIFNSALFYGMHLLDILAFEYAVIVVLLYSVFDVAFILFFCPFQKIFMGNRCCAECRIYNWDYIMMCTPLLLFPSVYSLSLIAVALAVLLRWEFAMRKKKDLSVSCASCEDRLCAIKRRFSPP